MRLVMLSDSHGDHWSVKKVPAGDVLIHCGDCTSNGSAIALQDFLNWFSTFPHPIKLLVAGNHDRIFQTSPNTAKAILKMADPAIHYLQDETYIVDEVKFYGTPWTPTFHDWFFMANRGPEIKAKWDKIPMDTDVLITHGPAYGYGDLVPERVMGQKEHAGCKDLADAILERQPLVHCFGHIHAGRGSKVGINACWHINCSVMDERYHIVYPPVIYDLTTQTVSSTGKP